MFPNRKQKQKISHKREDIKVIEPITSMRLDMKISHLSEKILLLADEVVKVADGVSQLQNEIRALNVVNE